MSKKCLKFIFLELKSIEFADFSNHIGLNSVYYEIIQLKSLKIRNILNHKCSKSEIF